MRIGEVTVYYQQSEEPWQYVYAEGHLVASFRGAGDLVSVPVQDHIGEVYPIDPKGGYMWIFNYASFDLTNYANATWMLTCEEFGLNETFHVSAADRLAWVWKPAAHSMEVGRFIGGATPPTE